MVRVAPRRGLSSAPLCRCRAFLRGFHPKAEIAYRVPSILAFACILWCLFVFIRTRSGPGIAFVCAVLPLFTQIYWRYSAEARSYECVVACVAMALVCYQRAGQKRWVIGLAASLFATGAFHYYGFFVARAVLGGRLLHAIQTTHRSLGCLARDLSGFLPARSGLSDFAAN